LVSAILIFIFGSSILAIIQSLLEDMNAW
jgi:hypothetical protein